ncbi:MAG TPA: sialidase family protein [Verrucomicrobiae bacterium]|nr:sialidase family protein [Verrucomicrobiae bacterium]
MQRMTVSAMVLCVAMFGGQSLQTHASVEGQRTVLAVPGRQNATASIAASGAFVVVTWGTSTAAGVTDVFAAVSRDAGRTFTPPVRVSSGALDVRLSGEQPPRVVLVAHVGARRDPSIVVVWTAKASAGTRLLAARSDNGGRSFGRPTVVPGSDGPGNRGWESAAADPAGHVIVAWLDHRELVQSRSGTRPLSHAASHETPTPAMSTDGTAVAQLSQLYVAGLDGTIRPLAVTGGVCYCCKTALAIGTDGAIYVAWRHVYAGDNRDIAFTLSRDGGRTFTPPQRVSEDHWVLNGCPENGPALAINSNHVVHVVWPTVVQSSTSAGEPTLALFHATTRDGRYFSPRQRIPTEGMPSHPWIVRGVGGALLVAWDEEVHGTRRVAMAQAVPDGQGTLRFTRLIMIGSALGEYPVVAETNGGYVMAWTAGLATQSVIDVERFVTRQ